MSDIKQHITLRLDAHSLSLNVDPEKEQTYREAAAWLNRRYNFYLERYRNDSAEALWVKVALEAAVGLHADVRDKALEPIAKKAQELNDRILAALQETENESN